MSVEWVEVRGKSIEVAVEAGLAELGLDSAEQADVEVLQEPERGFLGMGGKDAVVRLKAKPKRRRSRGRGRSKGKAKDSAGDSAGGSAGGSRQGEGRNRRESRNGGGSRQAATERGNGKSSNRSKQSDGKQAPKSKNSTADKERPRKKPSQPKETTVSREEQAEVVKEFLEGLLGAFGLEGEVVTTVDGDAVIADVRGEQTEALVGNKGAIMQAVHELTRTVVQRRTHENVRLRLDIAGYGERRREALKIYAGRLAEQVLEDGQERMLEPMNPADRKVIHDAIQEIEGVASYSEGEEPRRSVVISPDS